MSLEAVRSPKPSSAGPGKSAQGLQAAQAARAGLPLLLQSQSIMGKPDDAFEREAESAAEAVQSSGVAAGGGQNNGSTHGGNIPLFLRSRQPAGGSANPPHRASALGPGKPLGDCIGGVMGAQLVPGVSAVRIHTEGNAAMLAGMLGAKAFTAGHDIVFGEHQFQPETAEGRGLLAHELTHAVQQGPSGRQAPALQLSPVDAPPLAPAAVPAPAGVPSLPPLALIPEPFVTPPAPVSSASVPQSAAGGLPEPATGATTTQAPQGSAGESVEAPAAKPGQAEAVPGQEGHGPAAGKGKKGTAQAGAGTVGKGGAHAAGGRGASEGATETSGGGEVGFSPGAAQATSGTGVADLGTGELVLIDVELAEHQRWAGAMGRVGEAASLQRAEFIAESVGSGFITGAASGLGTSLAIGVISRAVPALGPIIGGGMALHGLATRDWAETGATIAKFGEGNDTYETLANSIGSIAAIIDVASQVLTVINGIVGVVETAAAVITGGAIIGAIFTFGATLAIAEVAGDVVVTCHEISEGISAVTAILDEVNAAVLKPTETLFRALHEFTTKADPREVEAQGHTLSSAAAASGAALGAWAGGKAAHMGAKPHPPAEADMPTPKTPHETPPPAAGEGPVVRFQEPPGLSAGESAPAETGSVPRRVTDDQSAAPTPGAAEPEQLTLLGVDTSPSSATALAASPAAPPASSSDATGGQLRSLTAPLELQGFGSGGPVPQGLAPGAIGTYGRVVSNPSEFARESNPGTASGARIGLMPGGREAAGVYGEHQTPAAVAHEIVPGHQYHSPTGTRRGGRDTQEAPVIAFPNEAKGVKDRLDAALLDDVRARKAAGEEVPIVEAIVRGTEHSKTATAQPNVNVPQEQIAKAFLADTEFFNQSRFGNREVAPGEALPAGHPLAAATQSEIDTHVDNLFAPHLKPYPAPGTQLSLPGIEGPAPKPTPQEQLSLPIPGINQPTSNPNQLSLPFDSASPVMRRVGEAAGGAPTRGTEPLTDEQYEQAKQMAVQMGMPPDQIARISGPTAHLGGSMDVLVLGPDLNPLPASERPEGLANPANAALEPRAVIGHEVIGHREAALGGQTRDEDWHEELQASARAALHTPELSREQRWMLLQDSAARRRFQTREGELYVDTERYGPAAEARGTSGGPPRGPNDEPSVIIDYAALNTASAETPEAVPPVQAPQVSASTYSPGAAAAARNAAAAPAQDARNAQPSTAHQVGALFLPDLLGPGGTAPTYEQQQAAHRARFTDDNQPAEGVERVNPDYPPPPGTPAQIDQMQNEIMNLLTMRATAEQEADRQEGRADQCRENQAPIEQTVRDTRAGVSAVEAHDQAVGRRQEVNQEQQQRQQESQGLVSGYPGRVAGMTALTVPLAAWEGFTSLASHLPGEAGDRMLEMNHDAQQLEAGFDQMAAQMLGVSSGGPAREAGLTSDAERLDATDQQAKTSDQQLHTASEGAAQLRQANFATQSEAVRAQQAAIGRAQECTAAVEQRQEQANTLSQQLQEWAQAHKAARDAAIAATEAQLKEKGYTVLPREGQ